ncbi:TetR/AcrR family transcriptional regulator [Paenibacillus sp. NPDC058071]|uniref:TetR/AcrR family transcriptional regulator n=1 Tax=Paenibacillus sp. NPDC058071 TaxID=3346326 RepID=UPI0036D9E29B
MRQNRTRDAIIHCAAQLFHKQGYHGTGLSQIIKDSSCPKGSLYYYFPEGKEQLALACIEHTHQLVAEKWEAIFKQTDNPGIAVETFIATMVDEAEASGFDCFFPVGSWVAVEASGVSNQLQEACQNVVNRWHFFLSEQLRKAGLPDSAAEEAALTVLSLTEGALHIALIYRDPKPFLNASKHSKLLIDHLLATHKQQNN